MGIPFLILLPYMIKRRSLIGPKKNRKKLWLGSLLNAFRMILYILSYKLTTIGNAVVLLYLWPLFALIFHSLFTKTRLTKAQILLLLLAFSGTILLNLHRDFSLMGNDLQGSLLMILSALIFSISTLIFRDALTSMNEPEVLYFQNIAGALIFLPILFVESRGVPLIEILKGILYGGSVGLLGFGCFFYALKRLSLFHYSSLTYIEVFFGVFIGVLVLSEPLHGSMVLGGLMIILASFLSRMISE